MKDILKVIILLQLLILIHDFISIPNHFFVSGEELSMLMLEHGHLKQLELAATTFVGVGLTDKLPDRCLYC